MSRPVPRRVRFEPHDQPPRGRPSSTPPRAPRPEPPTYESNRSRATRQDEPRYDTAGYYVPGGEAQGGYGAPAGHAPWAYRTRADGSAAPPQDDRTRFDMPAARYNDATRYEVPVNGNGGWRDDAPTMLNGGPYDPAGPRGPRPGRRPLDGARGPKFRKHRIRRLWRLRTVKVATALVALFAVWLSFSVGQALTNPNGGSISSKLAEWARDHYLGPVVTFGEWLTYKAPPVGGKPTFSLNLGGPAKTKFKHVRGFTPIIPTFLTSPASPRLPGEGVWHLAETVNGQPAMFTTLLRPDAVHTSIVAGIVSMDQRLLSFSLHPGSEDPGPANWGALPDIPAGKRSGLMATFNGGFKLDASGGGFYLNGVTKGTLTNGAASLVYYKNGTVKIGVWGRDVGMTQDVAGVRQNLKLLVDHGRVPSNVSKSVLSNWGATLGGGYYVWRSGIGITADGRVIWVYGPALSAQTLAGLLQRAGAVEAMQMDINPEWTSFESYHGTASDPTPQVLLPTQVAPADRYLSTWSRDFTAVYAR